MPKDLLKKEHVCICICIHIIYVQNIYTSVVEVWDNRTIDYRVASLGETLLGSMFISVVVIISISCPCLCYISYPSDSILSIVSILSIGYRIYLICRIYLLYLIYTIYAYLIIYLPIYLCHMLSYHVLSCLILFYLILSHLVYLSINLLSYPTSSFLFLSIQRNSCFYLPHFSVDHSTIPSTQKSPEPTSFSSTDRDLSNCGAWRYRSSS